MAPVEQGSEGRADDMGALGILYARENDSPEH